jgi:hypothetical protein
MRMSRRRPRRRRNAKLVGAAVGGEESPPAQGDRGNQFSAPMNKRFKETDFFCPSAKPSLLKLCHRPGQEGKFPLPRLQPMAQPGQGHGNVAGNIILFFHPGQKTESPQDLEVAAQGQMVILLPKGGLIHFQAGSEEVQIKLQQLLLPGRAQAHIGVDEQGRHIVR